MSEIARSGYLTPAALDDDGTGQINCPRKQSTLAIQRCHEYQRETAELGAACTCPVYRDYVDRNTKRCGTQLATTAALQLQEEAPMPRVAQICKRCNKPTPEGTHCRDGLCKPCRDKERPQATPPAGRVDKIKRAAERKAAPTIAPPATPGAPPREQEMLPAIARQEIELLKEKLAQKDQEIASWRKRFERVIWTVEGVRKGFATIEALADAAKAS